MSDQDAKQAYWRQIRRLTFGMSLVVAGFTIFLPVFMPILNNYRFLRFPLGYFLMANAAIIVLAVFLYAFFGEQQRSDRVHNMTLQF